MAKKKPRGHKTMASQADRYELYLKSVQSPDNEVPFFDRAFKAAYGRPARVLREDFCGTAAVCAEWVASRRERRALGVDIDPEPLAWGRRHNLSKLSDEARSRVTLLRANVLKARGEKADVVAAQNFSFFIFKNRLQLREYFRAARRNLRPQGILALDVMGGSEVIEEDREETRREKGFTYIWEQRRFDPISHECEFFIHFKFRDGSAIRRAFRYDWRLWSIPEIRELLDEAGFKRSEVYWENTDLETGEGNGVYRRCTAAPSEPAWVSYVVGVK